MEVASKLEHDLKDMVANSDEAKVILVGGLVVGLVILDANHKANLLQKLRELASPDVVGLAVGELAEVGHEELHRHEDGHHAVPSVVHDNHVGGEDGEGGDVEVPNYVHEILIDKIGRDGVVPLKLECGLPNEGQLYVPRIVQSHMQNTREEVIV